MLDPTALSIVALVFGGIASTGVVITLVRNGKSVTLANEKVIRQETELKTELKNEIGHVKEKLDDPLAGLNAIAKGLNEMRERCSGTTGSFDARIKNLEGK